MPLPRRNPEVHRVIQVAGTVRQHQRKERVCPCETGKPAALKKPRSWATYEPEQEMASGMGVLPGRERQAPVQQALQGLCPSLQAEFPDGGGILSALSFSPL